MVLKLATDAENVAMKISVVRTGLLALAMVLAAAAHADKPQSKEKADKHSSMEASPATYFTDARVSVIREYYEKNKGTKGCPPGLAKKGNGCQPPGQAKKWYRGDVLPADVVYYDIPVSLSRELGPIPDGHKVVRVGTDLLLIAVGTRMVIDALDDLNDLF